MSGFRVIASLATVMGLLGAALPSAPPTFDVIIRHGTVFDGSGRPGVRADVGIRGDRIMRVGDLSAERGRREYEATGLFVTPGFISVHDHTDAGLQARPIGLLTQGVTTAIGNPDGFGPVDIHAPLRGPESLGLNYGAYIGFNSVWRAVVGEIDRRPSPAEIARMRALVADGMRAGAFGVSAGLDYKPGFYATTDEVVSVVAAARAWRTDFPNHDRLYEGNRFSSLAGMRETIAIGERSGLEPVITHMHLLSRDQGRADEAFALFREAEARGFTVGVDAYPYTYAATALEQILIPAWAQDGGREAILRRFADPAQRKRIIVDAEAIIVVRIRGAGNVYLPDVGRELTAVMAERRISAGEAVVAMLEAGQKNVVLRSVTDADLERVLRDPRTAISCDCGAIASVTGHPRNWGSYPRFFGRCVRERGLAGWPEAIRRATALPAAMIGLSERGWLRPGFIADVTVFDPRGIADRATIPAPTTPSVGVRAVLVNGRFALEDGVFSPGTGLLLRREHADVSRAMPPDDDRRVTLRAPVAGGGLASIDMVQRRGAIAASGRAVIDTAPGERFRFVRPSLVQVAPGWAALTGIASLPDGREHAATLYLVASDLLRQNRPSLTLLVDGRRAMEATVIGGVPAIIARFSRPSA